MTHESQEDKPAQLERYIRESRRTQRQLAIVCALGAIGSIIAWTFVAAIGMWALLITVFVGGTGYYITGMHIQGWQHELYELQRAERKRRRA